MMKTKRALLHSGIALLVCISMFIGSTFAWFSDSVTSKKNIITAGNLDIEMYWTDDLDRGKWYNVEEDGHNTIFNYDNWEPGYTDVKYIKLVNAGSLALNYKLSLTPEDGVGKLAEVINVYYAEGGVELKERSDLQKMRAIGLLDNILNGGATADGTLLAEDQYSPLHPSGEVIMTVAMNMLTTAGNEYQNEDSGKFTITALATQAPFEEDSFGSDYDANAEYPQMLQGDSATATVTPINGKVPAGGVTLSGSNISAFVPEGTVMEAGADKLTLKVTPLEKTTSDIIVVNNEILIPVDVHIDGVAENNTVPIIVNLGEILPKYLNMGNYQLYHVENGANSVMRLVADASALTAHNTFTYDTMTGAVSVAMASFSEVTAVADMASKWKGNQDDTWYDASKTELYIVNADQLYSFAKIVGGMAEGIEQDTFSGKKVTLLSDINLNNGTVVDGGIKRIFYPVGYYNTDNETYKDKDKYDDKTNIAITSGLKIFEGTFDGAGHTISNIYQNTWEMKGDHDWYAATDQHYRDGMGIFGKVYGGKIMNLSVDNFKSDGEIATTGVIASYADGATFENIAITNCNPRVYNIGNGGIVGCVGWYAKEANLKTTFTNITVDNSNMISALWGSYDVPCGGIVGQYYPTSGQTSAGTPKNAGIHFENCHVAAVMDVYNDVCGNYQYYAYRYAGILMGSVRENETIDGHVYPKMDGITANACTVHFGTWNDYYYCEFEKNGHPSYSGPNDYKFSRTPHSELNFTDSNGNGKIDTDTERNSVTGCKHNHSTVEDNRSIYLPFNNLVTGYGWGVTSKAVDDMEGVEILDRKEGNSVEKFKEKSGVDLSDIQNGDSVSISDLFEAVEKPEVDIKHDTVMVAVTDLTKTGITAEFTRGETWDKGYLTFNGTNGYVKITIQDYYFCQPTSIIVKVGKFETTNRFEVVFPNTDKYLYRVGNKNNISVSSLFKAITDEGIGNVSVDVETIKGDVNVTKTLNSTWTNSTLEFSGTGVVKITITDDNFSTPVTLPVEVVDAKNHSSATISSLEGNTVLLCDTKLNGGGSLSLSSATLYGNGFEIDMTDGKYEAGGNTSSNYVFNLASARLDNVKLIGAVYTTYGAQARDDYNRAAVFSTGNSTIVNSYISNCASAVRVRDGNLEIVNSTIKGGNFANIDIRGGHVVLDNVTTINQVKGNDKAEDGTVVVGLGVVVYYENVLNTTTIEVKNGITQYNYLSKSQAESYIKDTSAKQLTSVMFGSSYSAVQFNDGSNIWVNTGILSMTETVGDSNISDVDGYVDEAPYMTGVTGYLHTQKPNATLISVTAPTYKSVGQGSIAPSYGFDYTNKNYVGKTNGSNDYCYEEGGTVYISMDAGDTVNWDTSILTATKNGQILDYTVSLNGTDYTGKKIAFNNSGNYEVMYTYTDSNNYGVDGNRNIYTYGKTYIKTVHINVVVVKASVKKAEFTMGSSKATTEKITIGNTTYVSATGVKIDNSNWSSIEIDGHKINYPIVAAKLTSTSGSNSYAYFPIFENVVTIKDYANEGMGDAFIYDEKTTTLPTNLTAVKGFYGEASKNAWGNLTNNSLNQTGASKIFKWASASDAPNTPTTYSNVLCYKSPKIEADRVEYITLVQYSYKDATTTYYYYVGYTLGEFDKTNTCVTSDTLVTLADGTQKRIDEVSYTDKLLVWNFYEGKYDFAPVAIIFDHGADNNTVIELTFSDGTKVKVVNMHQFYDDDVRKLVTINEQTVANYLGHRFAKHVDGKTEFVELISYTISKEYVEAWGVMTAGHYNIITADMISADFDLKDVELFNYFKVGEDMKYDVEQMQDDIEKYGLYTYADFADYLTYEQFVAFNVQYFKIPVGKGLYTYKGIIELIEQYLN